ncbi:MAG: hypothetical protein FOGNACKC_04725 [Anaerolineae bacterium]|nr:hypothetical protein [Anaerolineae bacterium]
MNNTSKSKAYLGRGLAFPLQIDPKGGIALASGERDIEQAIRIILETRPGERVMRPEFGCRAHEMLFEPRDVSARTTMKRYVQEALTRWEPRIDVQDIDVSFGSGNTDGAIFVEITYVIKESHDTRSIVYPFFLAGEENF